MADSRLSLQRARCEPVGCKQVETCARATDWPTGDEIELQVVDASVCLNTSRGSWCPMFIDRRGVALLAEGAVA